MTTTEIVNDLIKANGYTTACVLGAHKGYPLQGIIAPVLDVVDETAKKVTVKVHPLQHLKGPKRYDLIAIDYPCEQAEALALIDAAFRALNDGGAVVVRHCAPLLDWLARPANKRLLGQEWSGSVWKAVLQVLENGAAVGGVIATDWGIAILRPCQIVADNAPAPFEYKADMEYLLATYSSSIAGLMGGKQAADAPKKKRAKKGEPLLADTPTESESGQ